MVNRLARHYRSAVGDSPPWVLVTRWFFALGWLRAATEKLIDPHWWSGEGIGSFLGSHTDSQLAWYTPFVDGVVVPQLDMIVVAVVALQVGAGLSLLTGRALGLGLTVGLFLNLNFVAAGAVNPSVFYIVAHGALAFWLIEARPSHTSRRVLISGIGLLLFLAMLSAPLVGTLQPDGVIDDPAMMLLTLAVLGLTTTIETIRRFQRPGEPGGRVHPPRPSASDRGMMTVGAQRQPIGSS